MPEDPTAPLSESKMEPIPKPFEARAGEDATDDWIASLTAQASAGLADEDDTKIEESAELVAGS
jgi:hypothetical protein